MMNVATYSESINKVEIPIWDIFKNSTLRAIPKWDMTFSMWLRNDILKAGNKIEFKASTRLNKKYNSTYNDRAWHKGIITYCDVHLWLQKTTAGKPYDDFYIGVDLKELQSKYFLDLTVPLILYTDKLPNGTSIDFQKIIDLVKKEKTITRFDL